MKNNLQIIKDVSHHFFATCEILLFGSRAKNNFTEDSDYDLLLIINQKLDIEKKREYKAKIRRLLAQKKIPVDILIQSKSEIEIKKNITGHIVRQALKDGIIL